MTRISFFRPQNNTLRLIWQQRQLVPIKSGTNAILVTAFSTDGTNCRNKRGGHVHERAIVAFQQLLLYGALLIWTLAKSVFIIAARSGFNGHNFCGVKGFDAGSPPLRLRV